MWALYMVCGEGGLEKGRGGLISWGDFQGNGTWGIQNSHGKGCKGGEIYMYLVCDFNGRWLKDSSFLCCILILLKVEGKVVGII